MTERLVIFGNGQMAEFAYARFKRDSRYEVAGFTVDRSYVQAPQLFGLPVVAFDEVEHQFPPDAACMFIAVGPAQVNRIRADRFMQARQRGYRLVSYISARAIIDPEAQMGEGCSIAENAIVQPYARIGDNVRVGSASIVGHHCVIEDHCYLAVNCVLAGSIRVGARAFLGAGTTIRDRVSIGAGSIIGAGATIVRDVAPETVQAAPDAIQLPISANRARL